MVIIVQVYFNFFGKGNKPDLFEFSLNDIEGKHAERQSVTARLI